MTKVKIGVIGVGKLGSYHCEKLFQLRSAELTGIFDANAERATEISQKFKIPAFPVLNELLNHVEAVSVAVPTKDHFSICSIVLAKGLPVFVEKPIAATIEQARELVKLAKDHNTIIQVGHVERFNPALLALAGFNLKPMFIESHRLAPFDPRGTDVAVILDLMIHDIDIILAMVQSPVTDIAANGVAVVSNEADIANARLTFNNGCVANITASRISQRKMRKMRLFQKDAYISIDFLQKVTEIFRVQEPQSGIASEKTVILGQIEKGAKPLHIVYERPPMPEKDALSEELSSFISCIIHGTKPVVAGDDGVNALAVAMQVTDIVHKSQRIIEYQ